MAFTNEALSDIFKESPGCLNDWTWDSATLAPRSTKDFPGLTARCHKVQGDSIVHGFLKAEGCVNASFVLNPSLVLNLQSMKEAQFSRFLCSCPSDDLPSGLLVPQYATVCPCEDRWVKLSLLHWWFAAIMANQDGSTWRCTPCAHKTWQTIVH